MNQTTANVIKKLPHVNFFVPMPLVPVTIMLKNAATRDTPKLPAAYQGVIESSFWKARTINSDAVFSVVVCLAISK